MREQMKPGRIPYTIAQPFVHRKRDSQLALCVVHSMLCVVHSMLTLR
jgi:hypothetical protein